MLQIAEHFFGLALFNDKAAIHEDHLIGRLLGKTDLMPQGQVNLDLRIGRLSLDTPKPPSL